MSHSYHLDLDISACHWPIMSQLLSLSPSDIASDSFKLVMHGLDILDMRKILHVMSCTAAVPVDTCIRNAQ